MKIYRETKNPRKHNFTPKEYRKDSICKKSSVLDCTDKVFELTGSRANLCLLPSRIAVQPRLNIILKGDWKNSHKLRPRGDYIWITCFRLFFGRKVYPFSLKFFSQPFFFSKLHFISRFRENLPWIDGDRMLPTSMKKILHHQLHLLLLWSAENVVDSF